MTDTGRYDNTGVGGSFYSDYAQALSLAGSETVERFTLVIDSYGGNNRSFDVSAINAQIQGVTEPSLPLLLSIGLGAVGLICWRRKS